jgi:BirA family transcriptional regulator, biotin operon repressor / biotin---[acetyl-CoA-carboxylase] ligase
MGKDIVGNKTIIFQSLGSTNDHCKELLGRVEVDDGTVVWALSQQKGRGQGNNSWESEAGKNLTFSIILHPEYVEPSDQFYLSMVASLGVTDFLDERVKNVFVKWPNDIYAGSNKIAGILIENSVMENRLIHSIIGIGININQTSFDSNLPNPISIWMLTGEIFDLKSSLDEICLKIDHWLSLLRKREKTAIKTRYSEKLYGLNKENPYKADNKVFSAYLRGIDNFGRLALETGNGDIRYYGLKEVEFMY